MSTQKAQLTYTRGSNGSLASITIDDGAGNPFSGSVAYGTTQDFEIERSSGSDGCKINGITFYYGGPASSIPAQTFVRDNLQTTATSTIDGVTVQNVVFAQGSWVKFSINNDITTRDGGRISFQVTIEDDDSDLTLSSRDPQIELDGSN